MNGFICSAGLSVDADGVFLILRSVENPSHQLAVFQLKNRKTEGPLVLSDCAGVIRRKDYRQWLESAIDETKTLAGGGK